MYIMRDIFHLKFGKFKDAKALMDEARSKNIMPPGNNQRMLSDFTGQSYRLIMELEFESLGDIEKSMGSGMNEQAMRDWYEKFKPLVESSYREILKVVK